VVWPRSCSQRENRLWAASNPFVLWTWTMKIMPDFAGAMELQLDKTTIDIHNRLAVTATEGLKSTRHSNGWRPVEAVLHGKTRSSGR
jgi:hypothetical protein